MCAATAVNADLTLYAKWVGLPTAKAVVVEGHDDFTPAVIGTPNLQNWTSPVMLENKSGNDWTLPAGAAANFFRVRLSK